MVTAVEASSILPQQHPAQFSTAVVLAHGLPSLLNLLLLQIMIKWDNTLKQTDSNNNAIQEEIAKELCGVSHRDSTVATVYRSSHVD